MGAYVCASERKKERQGRDLPCPRRRHRRSSSLRNATRAYPISVGRAEGTGEAAGVEDFKATETIVQRRCRACVPREVDEGAQALTNAQPPL